MSALRVKLSRLNKALRLIALRPSELVYLWQARRSGLFDASFYRGAHPGLHPVYRFFPLRHFILQGEIMGLQPNPEFSPTSYLRLNPDVEQSGIRPFRHFLTRGREEGRIARELVSRETLPDISSPFLRFDKSRLRARFAVVAHIYYPDLWEEFAARLISLDIDHDLFITLSWRGKESVELARKIEAQFPNAHVTCMPNRGRDILPFVTLVNAGAFEGYEAVCKLHTKKSPHRKDGDEWRRHLINGILPRTDLSQKLDAFMSNPDAAFWVADGQCFEGGEWWGSNKQKTKALLRRVELDGVSETLSFPAGSIYWVKPLMLDMIRALKLSDAIFEPELGQVDGTLAHAFERAIGALAIAAGQKVFQTSEIEAAITKKTSPLPTPNYTSVFYLPQFHPTPENDAWWGNGFTEWRAAISAHSMFPGHLQPMRPADLGYYDLRATEVMGAQAALARQAGIDAFCVYHYWFDGRRILETPIDKLLQRPEIDFPFYLCWANESWRRNWDGLSGEVLLAQNYQAGFEETLVASTLPYMKDKRYQRPDGQRPRFVIYRPEDMPAPEQNVMRMRQAWNAAGIGEVELGAVTFHIKGENAVPNALFDFWVEMPPHGLVKGEDYLFGGPMGNTMGDARPIPDFTGLIYDYSAVARRACSEKYRKKLPKNTIAGIMPGWDNTARRGPAAHIAHGANPATFHHWLRELQSKQLQTSYRGELFINAWNEWAEKAVLEPSETFGKAYLDVLREVLVSG